MLWVVAGAEWQCGGAVQQWLVRHGGRWPRFERGTPLIGSANGSFPPRARGSPYQRRGNSLWLTHIDPIC